ncbi:GNAT family N-acetyltransferase [Piscibacillus sp. B03]|uniref:GNAT family N-acetyltransferase n=1 Tax=Piscibacillus sp. B03 TaxID=3457430 RepID=UPI003FCC4CC6
MFNTDRIYLRKLSKDDIKTLYKWHNDVEVFTNMRSSLDLYNHDELEEFYDKIKEGKSFIIVDQESQQEIGNISLVGLNFRQRHAEVLLLIGEKDYWGQGYGKEAFKLLLNYAFNELNLHRVSLKVFSFNQKAFQMYEKFGFQVEGKLREAFFRHGEWHDIYIMSLLQREYFELKG